jgi:uncharacterized membrane protein YebE (DUF533 family)
MLDAKRLLDQFLGGQTGDSSNAPASAGFDTSRMGDMARDIGGRLNNSGLGGIGGGALAGGLAGLLLGSKQGRNVAGTVLQVGGIAAVGALAYYAYRNWQANKNPSQTAAPPANAPLLAPPADTPFNPASEPDGQRMARNLLRAMIAAAKSDGHVDASEQARVFAEMDKLVLSAEDKAFVMDELRAPLDVDQVASAARTPEEATSIYTASLLAINVDSVAERGYLGLLASRLNLDAKLVENIHASVAGATAR